MKILAVSHSCVAEVNQQLFVDLHALPDTQVELIVPARWKNEYTGEAMVPTMLPSVSFPIHHMPVALPGQVSLHFYTRLPLAQLRKFVPDVLYSTQEPWSLSHWQMVGLARRLRVPLLFHTNQNIVKRLPPPFAQIEQKSYKTAAAALAFSEEARQVLVQKGLRTPSFVVPYGTDVSRFTPGGSEILRAELGLAGKVVIGYMGRFVPEKGLDTLVDAIVELEKTRHRQAGTNYAIPEYAVLMVGTGIEEDALRRSIAAAGLSERFVWTGLVPHTEAGRYMACMDIFVLPSRTTPTWKEQFGRVIIEAMACGVPVVGSDSGQIPHLLRDTGGGLIFREGDAADLCANLSSLVCDASNRQHLGEMGRRAVQEKYTFRAVARQTRAILQDTVDASSR